MRKLDIEDLKKEFVGKTFNWLTVLDVFIEKTKIKQYLLDLFSNIENSISFNAEHTMMNNNYPSINHYLVTESYVDHIYYNGHSNVYTCGYSQIL